MPTLDLKPGVHATTVAERRVLADNVVALALDAPLLARTTRPGQYVMAIAPSAEMAATALAIYEAEGKRASLLFFVTGKRTQELADLRPGDRLDVVGPLGNGFDCSGLVQIAPLSVVAPLLPITILLLVVMFCPPARSVPITML